MQGKIKKVLSDGDIIRVGDAQSCGNSGVLLVYSLTDSKSCERWMDLDIKGKQEVHIGKDESNDIILTDDSASKHHAKIFKENSSFFIEDLNSRKGTYVNGNMITSKHRLKELDIISADRCKIIFKGDILSYNVLLEGVRLDAINISKNVPFFNIPFIMKRERRKILDNISVSIKAGEFVALIGGSGAGKSTFMESLNGFRRPSSGSVVINGEDFYENYSLYKSFIGYVPQQDIVYDTLTVKEMLTYAAKLRMPDSSSHKEISVRIREVLEEVELSGREDVDISKLSGGQKKRIGMAVELLADPKIFFLDEPTSGLDPGMERNMMKLLRKLADKGKTIILITHATANLNLCDKTVILGSGGKLCYFGPSEDALNFFGVKEYADIYDAINKDSEKWEEAFRRSKHYSYFNIMMKRTERKVKKREVSKRSLIKQFVVLSSRYLKITLKDRQRTLFILVQAPLVGFLLSIVTEKNPFSYYESAKEIIFTLACSGTWIGVLNSIQEICKERAIYKKERAVNLRLLPYMMSKVLILGGICVIQAVLITIVFTKFVAQPNYNLLGFIRIEIFVTMFLTIFASTSMGLYLSALVSNSDRAMGLAPIILIPQLLFTGLVFSLKNAGEFISNFAISKWASRALAISFDLNGRPLKAQVESPDIPFPMRELPDIYNHQIDLLYRNWLILIAFALICIALGILFLKRQDNTTT
ncbi:MAG: ATP-binding cassette domain-containing protein [Clostridiaceae bacterium]